MSSFVGASPPVTAREAQAGAVLAGAGAPRIRLAGIEAGRGIAALLVVAHHAGANIGEPRFYGTTILGGQLEIFHVGVDFFFVLSGFIIAWMHWGDIGAPSRLKGYALRRLIRIYPPYWGLLIPLTALYFAFPGLGRGFDRMPGTVVASFALLPYPGPLIIGVAWTLVYEMLFYVLFGLVIAMGRPGVRLLQAWGVACVVAAAFSPLPFPADILLSPYNLEFLMGIATAVLLRRGRIPAPGLVAGAGAAAFAGFVAIGHHLPDVALVQRLAFGLPSAAVIAGLVELERAGRLRVPRPLVFLGGASYAIYLIHGAVMAGTIHALVRLLPRDVPLGIVLVALVAAGAAAGCLYHVLVERPLTKGLQRYLRA